MGLFSDDHDRMCESEDMIAEIVDTSKRSAERFIVRIDTFTGYVHVHIRNGISVKTFKLDQGRGSRLFAFTYTLVSKLAWRFAIASLDIRNNPWFSFKQSYPRARLELGRFVLPKLAGGISRLMKD